MHLLSYLADFRLTSRGVLQTLTLSLLCCFGSTNDANAFPVNGFSPSIHHASPSAPTNRSSRKDLAPIISKLEAQIQQYLKNKQIPGCSIAIVYKNEIVFMNGYGVRTIGKKDKIDADTVFQLGSISKPIAATLASVLENKGILRMEDPVNRYLPYFSLNSKQPSNALKVKHVLSHSTGVPRGGFNQLIEAHASFSQILKSLKNTPVRSPVGRQYDYNNAMYSVISEVTKSATKLTFSDALQTNLLQPLRMTRTSATYEGLLRTDNRAYPHTRTRRGLVPCGTYSHGYYTVAPAGGINSSARDMATFLKAQMGGYPQVLNHQSLARIQTPHVATKNMLSCFVGPRNLMKNASYGLGWRLVDFADQKMVFHGGMLKGFTNFIAFVPEQQVGIVVLHNGDTKFSSKVAMKFFELFYDVPQKRSRKEMMMPVANVRNITGLKNVNRVNKANYRKNYLKMIRTNLPTHTVSKLNKNLKPKKTAQNKASNLTKSKVKPICIKNIFKFKTTKRASKTRNAQKAR